VVKETGLRDEGTRGWYCCRLLPLPCPYSQSYFVSLCGVCLRQRLQNFLNSRRPVVVFLFFVVE
jgi:hypothetical protein